MSSDDERDTRAVKRELQQLKSDYEDLRLERDQFKAEYEALRQSLQDQSDNVATQGTQITQLTTLVTQLIDLQNQQQQLQQQQRQQNADADASSFSTRHMAPKLDIEHMKSKDFEVWLQQWNDFVHLSGLDKKNAETKMRQLRAAMTPNTLLKLGRLKLEQGRQNDVAYMIDKIQTLLSELTNVAVERRIFRSRLQREQEDISSYYVVLQSLIKDCKFCTACVDDNIKDAMLTGLASVFVKDELFKRDDIYTMSLEAFVEKARQLEQTERSKDKLASKDFSSREGVSVGAIKKSSYRQQKDGKVLSKSGIDPAGGAWPQAEIV